MLSKFVRQVARLPILGIGLKRAYRMLFPLPNFENSSQYWETRYRNGLTSGAGSYNRLANFKADFLNSFVSEHEISTVGEFGCGDGAQLSLAKYPYYIGFDVAPKAIEICKRKFHGDKSKEFELVSQARDSIVELALSLDVIYHLVEDETFDRYMQTLFASATRYVIIYSSNVDKPTPFPHVRERRFTDWTEAKSQNWSLLEVVKNRFPFDPLDPDNTSISDFYVFERR